MSDVREELAQLRRELDALKARLPIEEPSEAFGGGTSGQVNEAVLRHLQANLEREGKSRGIGISRVVVFYGEGGTGIWSGHITMSSVDEMPKGDKLRESVAALATDPLALRAVRKLIEPFFEGEPMQRTKSELAAALGVTEAEVERSLLPLVADKRLRWSKTATGEELYEAESASRTWRCSSRWNSGWRVPRRALGIVQRTSPTEGDANDERASDITTGVAARRRGGGRAGGLGPRGVGGFVGAAGEAGRHRSMPGL